MSAFSRRLFFFAIPGAMVACLGLDFRGGNARRHSNQGRKEIYDATRASKYLPSENPNDKKPASPILQHDVSMIKIISTPGAFDGKPVRVEGLLRVRYEEHAVYLTKEHSDHLTTSNAIWLDFSAFVKDGRLEEIESLDQRWALVEGIFDKNERGHLGAFAGSIREIWRIQEISPRTPRAP